MRQLLWEVMTKNTLQSTMREEEGGGRDMVAAKVRGQGLLGKGEDGDCHRIAGGMQRNDPSLAAAMEKETMVMARL